MFFYLLLTLLILSCIVCVHEFGHYFVARCFGLQVRIFSVGFGKVLLRFRFKGTEFRLCAFPIGGYISLPEHTAEQEDCKLLSDLPAYRQILICLAGPLANVFFAAVLFVSVFLMYGERRFLVVPQVDSVVANSPAMHAGIVSGDLILTINGHRTGETKVETIAETIEKDHMLRLEVQRDGQLKIVEIPLSAISKNPFRRTVGVSFVSTDERSFATLCGSHKSEMTLEHIDELLPDVPLYLEVIGPVGMLYFGAQIVKSGFKSALVLAAILSKSLGYFNLLPIPVLDGGRALALILSCFRSKKQNAAGHNPSPSQSVPKTRVLAVLFVFGVILFTIVKDLWLIFFYT